MRPTFHLIITAVLLCLPKGAESAVPTPTLRARNCSPLKLHRVDVNGTILRVSTEGKGWIFWLHGRQIEPDPEPSGVSHTSLLSENGQLEVATHSDGTIRWFSKRTGAERLAFCMDARTEEWIAFTPGGYYDGSLGGGRLVGWEVPGPLKDPDFFYLELLKGYFRRSAVVSRMLSSDDDEQSVAAAVEKEQDRQPLTTSVLKLLPPVMQVISPAENSEAKEPFLTVQVRVRSPSGGTVLVRANAESGAPVNVLVQPEPAVTQPQSSSTHEKAVPAGERDAIGGPRARGDWQAHEVDGAGLPGTLIVPIPPHNSVITLVARSVDTQAESEPIELPISWTGAKAVEEKPDVYLLTVGQAVYRDKKLKLEYAAADATAFAAAFQAQEGKSYRKVFVKQLLNEKGTRAQILDNLAWLQNQKLRDIDIAILFLAGHGMGNGETGRYYFLPYDAVRADPERTMLSASQIQAFLANRSGGRVMLFIDTCHSGSVLAGQESMRDLAQKIARGGNVVVFTSSTGGQVSLEWKKWGHGAFTKAVVEGLKGAADQDGSGSVTVTLLEYYVGQRVRQLTQEQQIPTSVKPGSNTDFPIAKVYVPPHRRRWFWWTVGGTLASALVASSIAFATQYHPDFQRGNTGWLVQF